MLNVFANKRKLNKLENYLKHSNGYWGIAAKNLSNNKTYYHNENKTFGIASVIKLVIAATILRKVEMREICLSDKIQVCKKDKVIGTGVLKFLKNLDKITLYDTMFLMIAYSDNTATNMCLKIVTKKEVNLFLKANNLYDTSLKEKLISKQMIRDIITKKKKHIFGSSTPKDILLFLERLHKTTLLDKRSCKILLNMMANQQIDYRFSRYLYFNENLLIGSKTGEITYPKILCNVGFIINNGEKIIISIFVKDIKIKKMSHFHLDHPISKNIGVAVKDLFFYLSN